MKELLPDVWPELRQDIRQRRRHEACSKPRRHFGSADARRGVIGVRERNTHPHSQNTRIVEPIFTCVRPSNHNSAERVAEPVPETKLRPFTKVTRIFMKQPRQQNASEEILGGEVRHGGAKTLAIGSKALAILGVIVVSLR